MPESLRGECRPAYPVGAAISVAMLATEGNGIRRQKGRWQDGLVGAGTCPQRVNTETGVAAADTAADARWSRKGGG